MTEHSQPTASHLPPEARRLHPLSPLAAVGTYVIPTFFALVVFLGDVGIAIRALIFIVILVVGASIAWAAWFRTSFWFDTDGDLRVASGVLFRSERRVQLSRLQAVDIHRPLVARIIGLAELRPEMAGGESGKVRLSYLTESDAQVLRNELLARSAGLTLAEGEAAAQPAPEQVLVRVPGPDLAVSGLLDIGTIFAIAVGIGVVVFTVVWGNPAPLIGLILAGGGLVFTSASYFMTYFDFTLAESPDGLRLRYGLLNTRSQTVPPGRVQAVRISRPILWRRRGWVRLQVNVAGYAGGSDDSSAGTMLLPVAPRELALAVLQRVLPGVDVEAVDLLSAPPQARRRAPFQGRRLAAGHDERVMVMRGGWLTHTLDVVPHARMQSARITQGPWQRALGLASMHLDSTPGPVTPVALHRDAAGVRGELDAEVVRARVARAAFRPERWMQS